MNAISYRFKSAFVVMKKSKHSLLNDTLPILHKQIINNALYSFSLLLLYAHSTCYRLKMASN